MMSDEPKNPEKKLFVDEDWKSQVEAEKEAARRADQTEAQAEPAAAPGPIPQASLTFLVSTLYLQGAMALGLLPNPATKKPEVQFEQARHVIDLLTMLQEKTEGNRTSDESAELEAALHELRMAFVATREELGAHQA
jgi:hypothetical protein